MSDEIGICKSSRHVILGEQILNMRHVASKLPPRLLKDEHKGNRVIINQELFDGSNADENIKNFKSHYR